MADKRTRTVTFADFRGGEFGDLGSSSAPGKSFTGRNVMVYQDGLLGPRPGVKEIAPSGMPTGAVWSLRGLGPTQTNGVVIGIGTHLYGFTFSPLGATTDLGSIAGTPTDPAQMIQYGADGYLAVLGDKAYKVDPDAVTITALSSAPGGRTIAQYGARTIVAGTTANPNRVYYSAANDPTSWPALNYFDAGPSAFAIVHAEESRNRLSLATTGQEWHALSGVPGVNDSLKRTPRGDLAPSDWFGAVRLGESLWFVPNGEDFPVQFTGTITDKLAFRHLRFTSGAGNPVGAAALPGSDTVCFVEGSGSNRMMVQHNGVWTFHALGVTASEMVSPVSEGGVSYRQNPLLLTDGGGASAAPKVYIWTPTLERPGKVGDTLAQPGDASTTPLDAYVSTPEWWTPDNSECFVRSVSVDFAKWDTGSASTNHFDLNVVSLHRFNQDGTITSKTQTFDEDPGDTPADRTLDRRVFGFGDQGFGHGFRLDFTNMRGIAIQRVYCHVEHAPPRS